MFFLLLFQCFKTRLLNFGVENYFQFIKLVYLNFSLLQQSADVKKQTCLLLWAAAVCSTSSATEDCRGGPQTS